MRAWCLLSVSIKSNHIWKAILGGNIHPVARQCQHVEHAGRRHHCNALDNSDDARAYIRCTDKARADAIAALVRGEHPDSNPDLPHGGEEFEYEDHGDGSFSYSYAFPNPYQRYEQVQGADGSPRRGRVAYFNAFVPDFFVTVSSDGDERETECNFGENDTREKSYTERRERHEGG